MIWQLMDSLTQSFLPNYHLGMLCVEYVAVTQADQLFKMKQTKKKG